MSSILWGFRSSSQFPRLSIFFSFFSIFGFLRQDLAVWLRPRTHYIYIAQAGPLTQQSSSSASCVEMSGCSTMPGFLSHWGDDTTDHQLKARRRVILCKHAVSDSCFQLLPLGEMTETTENLTVQITMSGPHLQSGRCDIFFLSELMSPQEQSCV